MSRSSSAGRIGQSPRARQLGFDLSRQLSELGDEVDGSVTVDVVRGREALELVPALDARITAASPDWPANRLGTLERNILRVGVYELEEQTVPREVAINEAVVLAKRYATDEAAGLVNGILARVAREQEAA